MTKLCLKLAMMTISLADFMPYDDYSRG